MSIDKAIWIGNRRELFWDGYLIEKSTAVLRQHCPERRGIAMRFDEPWEGNACIYLSVFQDVGIIRLYYIGYNGAGGIEGNPETTPPVVCYAESRDRGRTFQKPDLGLFEFNGSRHNNIVLMKDGYIGDLDNFAVFRDPNPACPPDERYKGIASKGAAEDGNDHILCYYKSGDGIRFFPGGELMRGKMFDSLNTAFWDRRSGRYFLYMRDWNEGSCRFRKDQTMKTPVGDMGMRGIRYSTSPDFKNWTPYLPVDFGRKLEVELYTNGIIPYYRADHVLLGMPTRYVERTTWASNYEYLPNPAHRRYRSGLSLRYGTALTDCALTTSRDGVRFNIRDEAFMTPGIERANNWVYGDCYPAWGLIETPSDLPDGAPDEISIYAPEYHSQRPEVLWRHAIRKDGFLSYYAPFEPCALLTKPFVFSGSRLEMNFSTSAAGYVRISLWGEDANPIPGYGGCEIFGNSLDRPVVFEKGPDVSALAGRPVRLFMEMSEADIYSFKFDE